MYNVQLYTVYHEYVQIKKSKDLQEKQFFGKSKVANGFLTLTNRRWQGKKVVPVRRRCSRGEWNVGIVGGFRSTNNAHMSRMWYRYLQII